MVWRLGRRVVESVVLLASSLLTSRLLPNRSHMSKRHDAISSELKAWIEAQKIFFVSTAPLSSEAHLNCSPKGGDSFRILSDQEVAYLDFTGSGVETIAHLQENGRILILFCAFSGPPRIVRLHGKGEVLYPSDPDFARLIGSFPENAGARAILRLRLTRISDSCGYSVPFFDYVGPRDGLDKWAKTKGPEELSAYRQKKNAQSIDGLPGYRES